MSSQHKCSHSRQITKTCPCNIHVHKKNQKKKLENFIGKKIILFIFSLKTLIVGTR